VLQIKVGVIGCLHHGIIDCRAGNRNPTDHILVLQIQLLILCKHIFALADRGIIGNALGIWGLLHQLGYLLKGFGLFVHLCIVVIHLKAAKNRRCEKQYGGSYTNLHLIFFH
jgi:hypothetical protein